MVPQPQTKNLVKLGRLLGYATAAAFTIGTLGIGMATLGLPGKIKGYKVSKDFYKMTIEDKKKNIVCETDSKDITLMDHDAQVHFFPDDHYKKFINQLYMGIFEFDPSCFTPGHKVKLRVRNKKDHRVLTVNVSKGLQKAIAKDFSYMEEFDSKKDVSIKLQGAEH